MRVLLYAAGSRGDFQPMLALAVGLRARGHQPLLAAPPNFAAEAGAFGVPFAPVGRDIQKWLRETGFDMSGRLELMRQVTRIMVAELKAQLEALPALVAQSDLVVGAGIALTVPTVAEAARLPYAVVSYTPQLQPTAHHPPPIVPFASAPQWFNRWAWSVCEWYYRRLLGGTINDYRREQGLPELATLMENFFPRGHMLLAADPELAPPAPDQDFVATGALALNDERPLPDELLAFLRAGEPPVYIGFGSMPDKDPAATTRQIVEAVTRAGCRAVLSSGWADLGGVALGERILRVGPLSHSQLFPQLAGAVHHGGAGTTAACARAGIPQLLIPHGVDQFGFAEAVHRAGLGPKPVPRSRFTMARLCEGLRVLVSDDAARERARVAGASIRARDPMRVAVDALERMAGPGAETRRTGT